MEPRGPCTAALCLPASDEEALNSLCISLLQLTTLSATHGLDTAYAFGDGFSSSAVRYTVAEGFFSTRASTPGMLTLALGDRAGEATALTLGDVSVLGPRAFTAGSGNGMATAQVWLE